MAVPKKRRSIRKRRQRRAQQNLVAPQYVACPNCKNAVEPHHVCLNCGHYKGKEIIRTGE
ncbi:MAG: 50S ribosomal protein L32 [Deltaproteobacteria bacterium GWA2_38_16]|nr:MAG: 50S ribosomal protein L32 [Deltaproteobacteria bacterium GWA2_38_16]OGQ02581.1 MAG: 50S ribosomal protein L32 [Deltaproteobacteria bacterium RIFCSPHIGHO2_02_FULL_38_15]OGQ34401.1 MAG: 50S ribosomal protein L32 [Deltaproteobacteria bacterium RIFCSPLOWO2_01_FULL_38_9]OGQ59932.1 MAG: 50S ribosomal protein L32 [Deltaproteobacteria bacterium RIFCSPLOWO2_12_FULL_38_8]HBQ20962.1 50S ribosomal protein L32 [Deltaproteobacteria bacterium]